MNTKRAIGIFMLCAPFMAIFIHAALTHGIGFAILIFVLFGLFVLWIVQGLKWIGW